MNSAFQHKEYLFRRKVFTLLGAAFHVYDENKNVVFYSRQKVFRIREDFRVYSDESMKQEILTIKTPHILDIWATYNVQDPTTGENVGSIKRRALKSILRDEWTFFSPDEKEIGNLIERSWLRALASRFLSNLIPQVYVITAGAGGQEIADIKRHFNPFILRYTMKIIVPQVLDPRLLIASGILLAGIERRQEN
ncbi:MAG: hypothetical protein PHW62_06520 [Candidatus Ratteibacteria bacterium]|nr:hypothetical protein [Candidatus Ratteibacteria bacterium]